MNLLPCTIKAENIDGLYIWYPIQLVVWYAIFRVVTLLMIGCMPVSCGWPYHCMHTHECTVIHHKRLFKPEEIALVYNNIHVYSMHACGQNVWSILYHTGSPSLYWSILYFKWWGWICQDGGMWTDLGCLLYVWPAMEKKTTRDFSWKSRFGYRSTQNLL